MLRAVALLLGVGLLAGPAMAADAPGNAAPDAKAYQRLYDVLRHGSRPDRDCAANYVAIKQVIASPRFGTVADKERASLLMLGSACAGRAEDWDLANRYALLATEVPGAPTRAWRMRIAQATNAKQWQSVVETLEYMANEVPEGLAEINLRRIAPGIRTNGDSSLRRRFLTLIAESGYRPSNPTVSVDGLLKSYAKLLAQDGDMAKAASIVARVTDPETLRDISLEPELRGLIPADFDSRKETERALDAARTTVTAHPELLAAQLAVARHLHNLGRPEEALEVLRAASPEGKGGDRFEDKDSEANWWWNALAHTYGELGRRDDAVIAFTKGMRYGEVGNSVNVSQTINLGFFHIASGREREALKLFADNKETLMRSSAYGRTQWHFVHGCASARTGAAEAAADLAAIRQDGTAAPSALLLLQLCLKDMDAAAAIAEAGGTRTFRVVRPFF